VPGTPYTRVATGEQALLYASEPAAGAARAYLLLSRPRADKAPDTLGFAAAWAYPGAYLYAEAPLTATPDALAAAVWQAAPSVNARGVAWVGDVATGRLAFPLLRVTWTSEGKGQVAGRPDVVVPFGNVEVYLPAQAVVAVTDGGLTITDDGILLQRSDGTGQGPLAPDDGTVLLSASPDTAGRLVFGASWDTYSLYALFREDPYATTAPRGPELRYTWDDKGTRTQLRYPVLPPAEAGGKGDVTLDLDATLDPLAATDGVRTRLLLRAGQDLSALATAYATTVAGTKVTLTPVAAGDDRAGIWFGRSPDVNGKPQVHLAPLGPFALGVPGGSGRLMCGLSGLEYLTVADGDVLDLVPGGAAYAPGFGSAPARSADDGPPPVLDPMFTTSWVAYRPRGTAAAYFAQPGASVSFGAGVVPAQRSGTMDLPAAVASRVRPVPGAGTVAFPLVPYGGRALPADVPQPKWEVAAAFERAVLSGVRGTCLRQSPALATLAETKTADPVFADASGEPLAGGRTATPQGLLVVLNDGKTKTGNAIGPAGTWRQVLLGRSGSRYLAVNADPATGTVDPDLASALLREQLFLVVSDWSRFPLDRTPPAVDRTLTVADFEVEFVPDTGAQDRAATIMVFKYATARPLRDLVDSPDAWAASEYFVGDATAVANAREALRAAIKVADETAGHPGDPFVYFRETVAGSPAWTGLVTFGAPINGNGMPADLQMLFAGIDGRLSAHHMGIEVNRIEPADGQPDIEESSLFGVVHYPPVSAAPKPPVPAAPPVTALVAAGDDPPPRPAFGFAVQQLDVAIRNSRVTDFHARVGVTINELFGRDTTLDPPAPSNTISIAGAYQSHGTVGTVTFESAEAAALAFNPDGADVRVLDRYTVTGASLVPVSSVKNDKGGTDVASRITLGGSLAFAADPFPGIKGVDLFSYGAAHGARVDGLPLANLALGVTFSLDKAGVRVGDARIVPDLSGVTASDDRNAVRDGSLAKLLPLTVSGFVQAPDGLDPTKVGGLPVHVLQLEPAPDRAASYTTGKPTYAVQLKLPLGSLGALSDVHASLDAYLVLAWGPSQFEPDQDGAALYVQLPQLSAGAFGFNLQGLLKTTFGDANLMLVGPPHVASPTYVLLFNNVALSVLGFTFPPQVITDFVVFADPRPQQAKSSALGWSLAATQVGGKS
jgi:hypothetical protein